MSTDSTRVAEPQLDDEVLVLLGVVDERVVRLHLAAQDDLRERRPVVRRVRLGGEDRDQRLAACLAVGVDEARGGAAAADDDDRVLRLATVRGTPRRWRPHLARAGRHSCPETACGTYGSSSRATSSAVSSSSCAASGVVDVPRLRGADDRRRHARAARAARRARPAPPARRVGGDLVDPVDDVEVGVGS